PARRRVGADCLGSLTELEQVIEENAVQSVILSARLEPAAFRDIVCRCLLHGCEASLVPADLGPFPLRVSNYDLNGWPMLELEVPHLHLFQVILKRSLDMLLSAVGIVLLLPVLVLVALAVRLDSPGPILFQQRRLGLGGRRFTIYKFRSMRADAEGALRTDPRLYREYVKNGFKLPADHDPRIGRVGAILRRTSLDELPQLFNVLKGDMSLVGPRPIVPEEIGRYGEKADVFLAVKPGITGYWQVNGRSTVGYPERALLDINYIRNWTLGTDLRLLLLTVVVVLWRRGAY
ncbi:MAG: exopolysaccharide biosynthesis polyprenyl glycosylphosphotransferase, partial [Gemmatimonadota bacterium]